MHFGHTNIKARSTLSSPGLTDEHQQNITSPLHVKQHATCTMMSRTQAALLQNSTLPTSTPSEATWVIKRKTQHTTSVQKLRERNDKYDASMILAVKKPVVM